MVSIFFEYIAWHYSAGIQEFLRAWTNIHWFFWRMFSVPLLLRTFFSPFRRMEESYGRGFDPQKIIQVFMGNMVTRMVGIIVRGTMLVGAFLAQLTVLVGGIGLFVIFIFAPAVILVSIVLGFYTMIS